MTTTDIFLNPLEEKFYKSGFEYYKEVGHIDNEILEPLSELNSINGLASLYSCQSHPEKNINSSYLIIKFSEELTYPITNAIYDIKEKYNLEIEWYNSCYYNFETSYFIDNVVIIRGGTDYRYFQALSNLIID